MVCTVVDNEKKTVLVFIIPENLNFRSTLHYTGSQLQCVVVTRNIHAQKRTLLIDDNVKCYKSLATISIAYN